MKDTISKVILSVCLLLAVQAWATDIRQDVTAETRSPNAQIRLLPGDLPSVKIAGCDETDARFVRYPIDRDKDLLKAQLLVKMITRDTLEGSVFLGRHPLSGERFYSIADGVTPGGTGFCRDDRNSACVTPLNQSWLPVRCLWLKRSALYPSGN